MRRLFAFALAGLIWSVSGCDRGAPPAPAPASAPPLAEKRTDIRSADPVDRPADHKRPEIAALDEALASPESARMYAELAPEATAIEAAARIRRITGQVSASAPEATRAQLGAYLELARYAASLVPRSRAAQDAKDAAVRMTADIDGAAPGQATNPPDKNAGQPAQ